MQQHSQNHQAVFALSNSNYLLILLNDDSADTFCRGCEKTAASSRAWFSA